MKQVITIGADGSIQGLMRKTGLDLRQFGKADIERVSLVTFNTEAQKFFVEFIAGPLQGRVLTHTLYAACTGKRVSFKAAKPTMLFDDYEDAVAAEIEVLDGYRLNPFPVGPVAATEALLAGVCP